MLVINTPRRGKRGIHTCFRLSEGRALAHLELEQSQFNDVTVWPVLNHPQPVRTEIQRLGWTVH